MTVLVNNRPIKFIIDSGSPVTLIPKQKFNGITTIYPLNEEYRDVNNNKIKFEGKTMANIEIDGEKKKLELLITTKRTNPILGLDWMKHLGTSVNIKKPNPKIQNIQEDPHVTDLKKKFKKLFHENKTVKGIEVDIQLKSNAKLMQQKRRLIPIHLQLAVRKELEKLTKNGHIEKATNIDKNCFISPTVITVKKDNNKNRFRLTETQRNHREKKSANAEHGGIIIENIQKNRRRRRRRDMDIKIRPGLRIRSTTVIKKRKGPMHICGNWRELYRLLITVHRQALFAESAA